MRSKPELDPELMSCPKPRRGKASPRWLGRIMIVAALGVMGVVAQADRHRSGPRILGMRNGALPLQQVAPGGPRQVPQLPPLDPSLIVAPRGIDDAMIKTARVGIDEAMIVNPSSVPRTFTPTVVPVPAPWGPGAPQPGPWQPQPGVPQPRR